VGARLRGSTGDPIQLKRGRIRIAPAPGSVEAKVLIASSRNCAIVREIGHRYIATRLGVTSVPKLGDRLSIGKGPR